MVETDCDAACQCLARIHAQGFLAELRLDYLIQPDLQHLLHAPRGPVIATNRLPNEGGRFSGPESARRRLLEQAIDLGADYVDVEFNADPFWRNDLLAHRGAVKLILSWHDFKGPSTPPRLHEIMTAMIDCGADIIKLVTYAHHPSDCLALLGLIPAAQQQGQDIIAFCMGSAGKYSRVIAPLLGSYLTFAVLEAGKESAPGQLTVQEMTSIWEMLT